MTASRPGRAPAPRGARWWVRDHWPALGVLLLVVASSYKWRLRDPSEAVSGAVDLATLLEVAAYGVVGLALLRAAAGSPELRRAPRGPLGLGAGYVALIALSAAYSPYPSYAAVRAAEVAVVLGLALAIARCADRRQLHGIGHGLLLLVLASVAYGVAVPSAPVSNQQVGRFTWLAVHPTVSSVFTALAVVLAVGYLTGLRDRPGPLWPRWAYAGALAVSGAALLASQSRGAAAGAAAGAVLVVVLQQRGRARVVLALVLAGAGGLLLFAGASLASAFLTRGEGLERLATLNARTELWGVAWEAVQQRPLYGYGVGSVRGMFYEETGLGGGHNQLINVAVEVGLVGLAVWTAFVVAVLLAVRRSPGGASPADGDRHLLAATVVALLVAGMFYDGAGAVTTLSSTWLFTAAAWASALARSDLQPARPAAPAVPTARRPRAARARAGAPAAR